MIGDRGTRIVTFSLVGTLHVRPERKEPLSLLNLAWNRRGEVFLRKHWCNVTLIAGTEPSGRFNSPCSGGKKRSLIPKWNVSAQDGDSFHLVNRVRPRRAPAMARLGPGKPRGSYKRSRIWEKIDRFSTSDTQSGMTECPKINRRNRLYNIGNASRI